MPIIKVKSGQTATLIGGKMCYVDIATTVEDEDAIKRVAFDRGKDILIKQDGKFIDAKDYFDDDIRTEREVADIESIEEPEEDEELESENGKEDMILEKIFSGHWKQQVSKAEENINTIEKLEEALEYAYDNGISHAVIERIEDMKNDLL